MLAACGAPAENKPAANTSNTNAANTTAKPVAAAPTKDALMTMEKAGWDAWVKRDAKGVESVMGKDFVYLSGMGPLDRAAALKNWSEPKCEGLEYTFSDPKAVSLTADVALVTYKADAKGKCDGKPVTPSVWVASFDMKEGDVWKNAFYTDIPR